MHNKLARIFIPTCNRPRAVAFRLDPVAAQTLPPASSEVIQADGDSEPSLALDPARRALFVGGETERDAPRIGS